MSSELAGSLDRIIISRSVYNLVCSRLVLYYDVVLFWRQIGCNLF